MSDPNLPDDQLPISETDTPPDHKVIGLELHADTLPEWFDRIEGLAARYVRRMAVIQRPEFWYCKLEMHQDRVEDFHAELAQLWEGYQADVEAGLVGDDGSKAPAEA